MQRINIGLRYPVCSYLIGELSSHIPSNRPLVIEDLSEIPQKRKTSERIILFKGIVGSHIRIVGRWEWNVTSDP